MMTKSTTYQSVTLGFAQGGDVHVVATLCNDGHFSATAFDALEKMLTEAISQIFASQSSQPHVLRVLERIDEPAELG
jgi:hypothetical protein